MDLLSLNDNSLINSLPNNIFTCVDDDFYSFVKLFVGETVCNILRIQLINSARKLLNINNVFEFFQLESEETDVLKAECCFKLKNGQYIVKPGIQTSLSGLIMLLKQRLNQEPGSTLNENSKLQDNYVPNEFIEKHPLLKSLIKWYRQNDSADTNTSNEFMILFIDNLLFNLTQSSNNYRYHDSIKHFSLCLYIIGGRQLYEFIRLNLPGAIPSLTFVHELISASNTKLSEAEFKFESVQQFNSNFGFCSEDTTGVVRRIEYDVSTNSFVGFSTPVRDGLPLAQHFQADTFEDLKQIYDANETARLLNVHMCQPISTDGNPTIFPKPVLFSAYGIDNKFTAMDVLRRWLYIFQNFLNNDFRIIGFSTGNFHLLFVFKKILFIINRCR